MWKSQQLPVRVCVCVRACVRVRCMVVCVFSVYVFMGAVIVFAFCSASLDVYGCVFVSMILCMCLEF